jgi:hypothetical protein
LSETAVEAQPEETVAPAPKATNWKTTLRGTRPNAGASATPVDYTNQEQYFGKRNPANGASNNGVSETHEVSE